MAKQTDDPAARPAPEGDLAQMYAELELLYRTSPVGLCLYDRDLRYVRINERLAAINGRSVEAHIGRTMQEIVPELADDVVPLYRRVLETGEPSIDVKVSCPVPSDPETLRHWLVSSYPFKNVAGELVGVSVVVREVTEVHRARDILKVSEARYRALVEQAPEAIVVLDIETGCFVDMNQIAIDLFGLAREQMLQVGPGDVSPEVQPDGSFSSETARAHIAEAIHSDDVVTFAWTHRHADGHLLPCEVRLTRLPTQDRDLVRGSILDISDRARAEQALQMSEARYRSLVEHAPDAICVLDADTGRFVEYNENALKLFGVPRQRFLDIGPITASPEFQPDGTRSDKKAGALIARARQGGMLIFEWTHRKPDGSLVPCEVRLLRLPGHGGRLLHVAITDITERKREELTRRRNENRLRLLVESTDAVPWEVDLDTWMFTYVGPQVEQLLGHPVKRWFEKGFWESRIHPEDRAFAMRFCQESAAECENYSFEYRMLNAKGEIIWVHDLVSVEQGVAGTPARLRGFMLDVTARKRVDMLQAGQKRVLERLAHGEDLTAVLCELARTIDEQQAGMRCSILLLDEDGQRLRHGAAPNLPTEYTDAVDGLLIGPTAGSCGTAAFRRARVVVSDVTTDPLWNDYRHLALPYNLRACWSQPILSQSGDVLGTFAMYHEHTNQPSASDLELIEQAAYLAGVAIEKQRSDAALRASEAALRRSHADLQHLAGRLISAQEDERRRLARDLHDDLTQRLAVLAIEAGKLERQSGAKVKALRDGLRAIRDEMVRLSEDVHGMSRQLHPALLEDLGLVDALESECGRFSEREGIKTTFRASRIPADIPHDVALCFYRVAQECLRNIGKHSSAKKAQVELRGNNGDMHLSIHDDGSGFDPVRSSRRGGVGLASMGERIRMVNGSLGVRSRAGQGTTIEVRVPLSGDSAITEETGAKPAALTGKAPRTKATSRAARPARRKAPSRRAAPRTTSPRRRRTPRTT